MNEIPILPRKIKTGGDPRKQMDYAALHDELSKLTHPARPDVNWRYAEKLCLSLFEQNGVELQTAAWYTLARTQLAGLFGLNEGLTILEALINHQWGALWPQPVHARMEILRRRDVYHDGDNHHRRVGLAVSSPSGSATDSACCFTGSVPCTSHV